MSTKKTTTSQQNQVQTIQRDPQAMAGYHSALTQAQGLVNNPYGNPFFQQTYNQGMLSANAMNQGNQSNLMQSMQRNGLANSPAGAMLQQMGGYMGSHNRAGAFNNASSQAQNMYGMGMNFLANPLTTGQTSDMHGTQTETTGGLGTWLPQVIGAGLGAATGGLSGGLTGALKGAMGLGLNGGSNGTNGNAAGGFMGNMGGMNYSSPTSIFANGTPGGGSAGTNPFGMPFGY